MILSKYSFQELSFLMVDLWVVSMLWVVIGGTVWGVVKLLVKGDKHEDLR